mmetsp:Transcript_16102/g.25011  ORF Transcript_16102/g.25011 Transcript_16102/m.25011 type:complete len:86 (-) Transcript_16102:1104-1361(-)
MSEHQPYFLTKYIRGPFHDYYPDWYTDVGLKILQTMLINAIMPLVQVVVSFIVPMIKQKLDNKFTDNPYVTRQSSMQKYKLIYSG